MQWNGSDVLHDVLQGLTNIGASFVFVWDISFYGAFLDYYALRCGLPEFSEAIKRKGVRGAAEPCYSCMYAAGRGVLNFRLTLRRTKKTHEYGGGRIGGLHTVEYRGMTPFYGTERREDVQSAAGLSEEFTAENGAGLYKIWAKEFSRLCGENVEELHYLRKVYTIGGAARRRYLRERYKKDSLRQYQKDHPQFEDQDDDLRRKRLLLAGMIIAPQEYRGRLLSGDIYKYDVNGLYTDTANRVGDLGAIEESDLEHFFNDRTGKHVYILIVKNIDMWRKKGMPFAFVNPFTRSGGNHVFIEQEFAVFRELWERLEKFYDITEWEAVRVLRARKLSDESIISYNEYFQREKATAKESNNEVARQIAKLFLNALIGKFSQNTKYIEQLAFYEGETDSIRFAPGRFINNWECGHFHFLRGAYIYTMARVRIMQDMEKLFNDRIKAEDHHFYTDTDSIVTDLKIPPEWIGNKTGQYKIEKRYTYVCIFAQKVYYGKTADGVDELTAAGIPKGVIINQIHNEYGMDISAEEVYKILSDRDKFWYVPMVSRVPGGAARVDVRVHLSEIDINKFL